MRKVFHITCSLSAIPVIQWDPNTRNHLEEDCMADIVLLAGRIFFVALLVLLLLIVTKTGVGLVKGQREGDKTWKLYIKKGPDAESKGKVIPVLGPLTIGRASGADIVIQDKSITGRREHAQVDLDLGELTIEDLNSTNGTYVNKHKIDSLTYLKPGDTIQVGDTFIEVKRA